ncbi:MAG: ABC transporter ATP-binding protein [Sarcina sp.]
MLEVKELSKTYGASKIAVDNVNFKIKEGELCGLIGHNGAGKTTTLKMIMGILRPTRGKILIDGKEFKESIEMKKLVSYVPDKPMVLLELTGNEYLNFVANMYEIKVEERNNLVQDLAQKFKIENDLNARISSYSHGMRKKIMIMGAFLSGAKILILDEPLTGLDPEAIYILKDMMSDYCKKGNSIIFSTHLLAVAQEVCSKFIFLNKGQIKFNGDLEYISLKYGEEATVESVFMDIIKEKEEV